MFSWGSLTHIDIVDLIIFKNLWLFVFQQKFRKMLYSCPGVNRECNLKKFFRHFKRSPTRHRIERFHVSWAVRRKALSCVVVCEGRLCVFCAARHQWWQILVAWSLVVQNIAVFHLDCELVNSTHINNRVHHVLLVLVALNFNQSCFRFHLFRAFNTHVCGSLTVELG